MIEDFKDGYSDFTHMQERALRRVVEDAFNVPIALCAFRDKGSRLWSFKKKKEKKEELS